MISIRKTLDLLLPVKYEKEKQKTMLIIFEYTTDKILEKEIIGKHFTYDSFKVIKCLEINLPTGGKDIYNKNLYYELFK